MQNEQCAVLQCLELPHSIERMVVDGVNLVVRQVTVQKKGSAELLKKTSNDHRGLSPQKSRATAQQLFCLTLALQGTLTINVLLVF